LRAIKPAKLPTDNDVIASMVEYYKDNLKTSGKKNQLDDFTKYTFSFSGLECRILGTFYRDENGKIRYSSSRRFQDKHPDVPVYVSPSDFLGKRTALFGMTRTGKSNTVKKQLKLLLR